MSELKDFQAIDIIKHLEGLDEKYIIRTPDQDVVFTRKKVDTAIGESLKKWAGSLEEAVLKTGAEKSNGENATDFAVRAIKVNKEGWDTSASELTKIKDEGVKGDKVADELKAQLATFKDASKKEIQTLNNEISKQKSDSFASRVDQVISDAVAKIRPSFKKDIDAGILDNAVQNVVNTWRGVIKPVDHEGTIIFHDKDDKPIIDTKEGNHLGAYTLLQTELDSFIDKGRKLDGNGSTPPATPPGTPPAADGEGDIKKFKVELPSSVVSQVHLTEYLKNDRKLDPNSQEFNDHFMANREGLPMRAR